MKRYEDNRELLRDLEQRLWKAEKRTDTYPPFHDQDVIERLLPTMFPGLSPRDARKLTGRGSRRKGKRLPRHVDRFDTAWGLGFIQKLKLASTVREALGYNAPIPLERLGDELAKIEQEVDKKLSRGFWYPKRDYLGHHALGPETEGLHIWEIDTAFLPNLPITVGWGNETLNDHVDSVSEMLNCHPALALAFLLCDTPVHRDSVTVVLPPYALLYPNEGISLYVGRAQVPVWLVSFMYRLARKIVLIIENRGQPIANSPRPRAESRRVAALVGLVDGTDRLKWAERLSKWNDDHPEWKYDNVNSMRAVYYRAAARARRPTGRLKARTPRK